jgi:protein phosphatase
MLAEKQISETLGSAPSLQEAAVRLIRGANEAGGRDNITVVLFRVEDVVGSAGGDEETIVGAPGVKVVQGEAAAAVAAPPRSSTGAGPAPLARTQGRPAPARRRRYRYAKPLAALTATVIVLALVLGGGYLASRQLYFISTNSQGIVTIYRGLPYDLPAGIRLYETFYVSGVPASLVPADRRKSLFNDDLRSQGDAESLVRALELGQVAR